MVGLCVVGLCVVVPSITEFSNVSSLSKLKVSEQADVSCGL